MRSGSGRPALLRCAGSARRGMLPGYIQSWWGAGNPIPERSAQRVLKAADQILRAGREQAPDRERE